MCLTRAVISGRDPGRRKLVGVDFSFVDLFVWALSGFVVVVEAAISSHQLLDVTIVGPAVNLVNNTNSK